MKLNTSTATAVAAFAVAASAQLYPVPTDNHTCVLQPAYKSCSTKAIPANVDTCCVETFGGLVLQTQVIKRPSPPWIVYLRFS